MRTYGRYAVNGGLVVLCVLFGWANLTAWHRTGNPTGLGLTVLEAWTAGLFLLRRAPSAVSTNPLAWLAGPIGTGAMLPARPSNGPGISHLIAEPLQLVGVAIAMLSLGALGRSLGIVAANRGVRTRGPYRIVRHPVYFGYVVAWLGYVLENPSARNLILLAVGVLGQALRIREEERLLSGDTVYRQYMLEVRHRLVPYVF
jgi:protein-S-isoprenylcysteine O-methyltransferase Ste14